MSDLHVFDSDGNAQYPEQGGTSTDIRNAWANKRYLVVDASDTSKPPAIVCYVNAKKPGEVRKQYYIVFRGSSTDRLYQEFLNTIDRELGDWEFITGEDPRQDVYAALREDFEPPQVNSSLVDACIGETTVRCEVGGFHDAVRLIRSLDITGRRFVIADEENGISEADLGIYRNPKLDGRFRFDDKTTDLIEQQKATKLRDQALHGITEYAEAVTTDTFLETISEEVLNRTAPNYTVVEREAIQETPQETSDPTFTTREMLVGSTLLGVAVGIIIGLYLWEILLSSVETTLAWGTDAVWSVVSFLRQDALASVDLFNFEGPWWALLLLGAGIVGVIGLLLIRQRNGEGTTANTDSNFLGRFVSDRTDDGSLTILEPTNDTVVTLPLRVSGESDAEEVTITLHRGEQRIKQKVSMADEGTYLTQFTDIPTGEYEITVVDGNGKEKVPIEVTTNTSEDDWTVS